LFILGDDDVGKIHQPPKIKKSGLEMDPQALSNFWNYFFNKMNAFLNKWF